MKLSRGDILRSIGSKYYVRGDDYFKKGYVNSLVVEKNTDKLTIFKAEVRGSGARYYEQRIVLRPVDGYIVINGDCSCPVSHNCKHVVAACLQYVANNPQREESSPAATKSTTGGSLKGCLNWLDAFAEDNTPPKLPEPGIDFILYILAPSPVWQGKLKVEFYVTRLLKNGGLGKGRNAPLESLANIYGNPSYVKPIDHEIGKLMSVSRSVHALDLLIQGETGYFALKKMIESGRCLWNGDEQDASSEPLVFSDARQLELNWLSDKNGDSKLRLNVVPKAMLLLTEPALYLDPVAGCVGLLDNAPYSARQLQQLLDAPTVPAAQVAEFSRHITEKLPQQFLPPPVEVKTESLSGQAATPCLYLSARHTDEHHYHIIRLRFMYGGYQISRFPEATHRRISKGDKVILIDRDEQSEQKAIARLVEHGFAAVKDNNDEDMIFLSLSEAHPSEGADRLQHFLSETVPTLEQEGWQIAFDDSFNLVFHDIDNWDIEIEEQNNDWFNLHFDLQISGRPLPLLPLVSRVLAEYDPETLPEKFNVPIGNSEYVTIQREQISPFIETLYELYETEKIESDGSVRMSRFDAGRLNELERNSNGRLNWHGGAALRKLGNKLKDFDGIKKVAPPNGLRATLRQYQQQGLNWLQFLREYELGGVLADDMGLGKTVQTLAHILLEKESGRLNKPCLIIAPTSLMSNWRREAEQFAPDLNVLVLHGPKRHRHFAAIEQHDIVLSTYPLLARDEETLLEHHYHMIILDEAQVIKNPKAKAAKVLRRVRGDYRLCLTGTPMENHLGELWALFDFLMPGFLTDQQRFNKLFRTPIEKEGNDDRRRQLAKRVAPFMLRRTKAEVVDELPAKTEIIRSVRLEKRQAALYESIRLSMERKVKQAISNKGLARSHITILDALLKLRQACCDPRLLQLTQAKAVEESAKLELLMQLLPEMVEEGRRILLFSQFTKMLTLIESELKSRKINYSKLTGQTRDRDKAIEQFKSGKADVFLISLKAGGVGLNLTEADTVIHYDPWWNPAAENQATDRAYRIGQNKAVFVYKLVTENTVEEKIIEMQDKKQALAQGVYNKEREEQELDLSADDMEALFSPLS